MVHLELTREGEQAARQIPHVLAEVLNLHLKDFKSDELATLMGFLERMIANGTVRPADAREAP